ncbi:MAG: cell division protein SepF [Acidimicrobiales bacterium]
MASFGRKLMAYLGLNDDDYDEYEEYEEPVAEAAVPAPRTARVPARAAAAREPLEVPAPGPAIRPLVREDPPTTTISSRPSLVSPVSPVRAIPAEKPVVHVVAPARFADAQEIGDRLKALQPVIVNLQVADRELARRMIDFCSGITYALGGSMEKVAEQVFLLSPSNVSVSPEERQRLHERGLYSR